MRDRYCALMGIPLGLMLGACSVDSVTFRPGEPVDGMVPGDAPQGAVELVVSKAQLALGEAAEGTFTVALRERPAQAVMVRALASDDARVGVTPDLLVIEPEEYATPRTITVLAKDDEDLADEQHAVQVQAAGASDAMVQVAVEDDDSQAVRLNQTTLMVNEGGVAELTVRLGFKPAGDVTVELRSSNPGAATVEPSSLVFTAANYGTPQSVLVSGTEDANATPAQTLVMATASGALPATVNVTNVDNDVLEIVPTVPSFAIVEHGAGVFAVQLGAQPETTIVVTVSSTDPGAAMVSPSSLIFTPGNWNQGQAVQVTGAEDTDALNERLSIALESASMTARMVSVTVNDNDLLLRNRNGVALCEPPLPPTDETFFIISLGDAPPGGSINVNIVPGPLVSTPTPNFTLTEFGAQRVNIIFPSVNATQSTYMQIEAPGQTTRLVSIIILDSTDDRCRPRAAGRTVTGTAPDVVL